jgi:hypothetical protein
MVSGTKGLEMGRRLIDTISVSASHRGTLSFR